MGGGVRCGEVTELFAPQQHFVSHNWEGVNDVMGDAVLRDLSGRS